MRYIIKLVDKENNRIISEEQGQSLMAILASQNSPKFVKVSGELINTSQIMGVFKDNGYQEPQPRLPQPKPTPEAIENRKKIIQATKEKMGWATSEDEDNLCGKPHNNGEESCSECLTIKMGI